MLFQEFQQLFPREHTRKEEPKPNKEKYQNKSQLLHKERRFTRYITNVAMRISGEKSDSL